MIDILQKSFSSNHLFGKVFRLTTTNNFILLLNLLLFGCNKKINFMRSQEADFNYRVGASRLLNDYKITFVDRKSTPQLY